MLNIAAISLYMMLSGVTGASDAVPMSPMALPEQPVQTVEQKKEIGVEEAIDVETYVKDYFRDIPILAEVARCESHFRQTDKNGKVIRGIENRSDVGVMQINEFYHSERAKSLNIDLHSLNGNLDYARKLYSEKGTYPWMASSSCWSKVNELALK